MSLFCTGFNLYGQCHNIDKICIDTFKKTHCENVIDLEINQLFLITREKVIDTKKLSKHQNTEIVVDRFLNEEIPNKGETHLDKKNENFHCTEIPKENLIDTEILAKHLKTEIVFDDFPKEGIPQEKESHLEKKDEKFDCTDISKTKLVYHGYMNEETGQEKELFLETEVEVIQISVSDIASLFLTNKGEVWSLKYINRVPLDAELLPNLMKIDYLDQIVKIACGRLLNCVSTKNGCIYNIPSKLKSKIMNIKDMYCGREHCVILTEDGLVYSFGGGSRGQLGHGDVENVVEPKVVDGLRGINIIKIACGGWHSAALSSEGDVYVWGCNSNGQLGLKTNENDDNDVSIMASPTVIDFDINIIDIACGSRHTVALSENSILFGCGWNKYCQLGYTSVDENCFCMKEIYDFNNMKIMSLKCGTWSTAVLVGD